MATKNAAILKIKAHNAAAAARRRLKSSAMEAMLVRQGSGLIAAAAIGTMNRRGINATFGEGPGKEGIPWKPLMGSLALIGAAMTKGSVSAAFEGISIASNAIYAERAISTKTLIAGEV